MTTSELEKETEIIKVKVNDSWMELIGENKLMNVIHRLSMNERSGIAIAVNSVVVQKKEYINFVLRENDDILIIEAAQGG